MSRSRNIYLLFQSIPEYVEGPLRGGVVVVGGHKKQMAKRILGPKFIAAIFSVFCNRILVLHIVILARPWKNGGNY